jgi:hypothetical protein
VLQGLRFAELGDFEEAVGGDREAGSVYTGRGSAEADRYRDGYQEAIQSLTQHLTRLGRTEREIDDELDRVAPEVVAAA